MLFWMGCKSTVDTLFCIILKASRVPETQGLPGFTVSFSRLQPLLNMMVLRNRCQSKFNTTPGFIWYRCICNILPHLPHKLALSKISTLTPVGLTSKAPTTPLDEVLGCHQALPAPPLILLTLFKNISPTGQNVNVHFIGERSGTLTIPLWICL